MQRVVAGSLRGSTLTFGFAPAGSGTEVTAVAQVPRRGPGRLAGVLLAPAMRRALVTALDEDRHDLESASYSGRRRP